MVNSNDQLIEKHLLDQTIENSSYFSIALALLMGMYGFTSFPILTQQGAQVTLLGNVLPRLILNTMPLVLYGLFARGQRFGLSSQTKLSIWEVFFPLILHIASWIHVWPLALRGNSHIMLYVHAANCFVVVANFVVLGLPFRRAVRGVAICLLLFLIPVCIVVFRSNDMVAVTSITGDLVLMLSGSIFFGNTIYKLRKSIAVRELENQEYASRFLGPAVSRAIFEENREILKTEKKIGFILMIDIRDSTKLVQESPQKWLSFQAAYFKAVAAIVKKHGGYIQKTQGDCHVINFGVVEYHPDLSDIAGLEEELARAEERRLKQVSDRVFACADEIFDVGMKLGVEIVGEKGVCFGGGVDKGLVEKRVQGDEAAFLELEVNGDAVHCAARLQDHSKKIRAELCPQDSILLVSPFASDYLTDLSGMQRISALDNPIRNYPGIKWVLAKVYKNPAISSGGLEKHVA